MTTQQLDTDIKNVLINVASGCAQFTCKHILFILACDTYFAFEVLTESVHP